MSRRGLRLNGTAAEVELLLDPATIRARARAIYELARAGKTNFRIEEKKFPRVVGLVLEVTKQNYPDLNIPFHARWRHFQAGGTDRNAILDRALAALPPDERARTKLDLAVVSVLLDAGAGPRWKFSENDGAYVVGRSEGLAIASFYMFLRGIFASDPQAPFRVDAEKLERLDRRELEAGFQISAANPMEGFDGRCELMHALGRALRAHPEIFGARSPRPGNMLDYLRKQAKGGPVRAKSILRALQAGLGAIWPDRVEMNGVNLGDVWAYPPLGTGVDGLVPFHKLSQWLAYSLIEPIEETGTEVAGVDELTGLAEYRNGGLMLDSGLIQLRDPELAERAHAPESELVVEWRALTVVLLDRIGAAAREQLGKNATEFPLAKILEGGTWWAGRKLAAERAPDASPPLKIISDGTVF